MTDRRYRAILIGNSRFAEAQLDDLTGPPHDLPLLAGVLARADRGLFAEADVRRVAERRRVEIESAIEDFFAEAAYDDVLLFYYSGHGVLNADGELFLCAADTNLSRLRSTAIGSTWLNGTIEDSATRNVVIMLDCCHSGAFKGGDITAPLATGSGRFVLTSSRGAQLSVDNSEGGGASAFTAHLVDGLDGAAGTGSEITVSELYQYTHRALAGHGRQEPQFRVTGAGELVISHRTAAPPPAPPTTAEPLALSVAAVTFAAPVPAGTAPPVTRVYVTGPDEYAAESPADWVSLDLRDGAFDVSIAILPPGTHQAFVYVRGGGRAVPLPVEVTVASPAQPSHSVRRSTAAIADMGPLSTELIQNILRQWLRSAGLWTLKWLPPTEDADVNRARRAAAVPEAETTFAYIPFDGGGGIIFTDESVYWMDASETVIYSYPQFAAQRIDSRSLRTILLGPTAFQTTPYDVGLHAMALAAALNKVTLDLKVRSRKKR